MNQIYEVNGLVVWEEKEIILRESLINIFSLDIIHALRAQNNAWSFNRIEASILTPIKLLHPNYEIKDVWGQETDNETGLMLRPETTQGSYAFANQLINSGKKLPLCIWQVGKSFRREQTQSIKHMKLKEFYQMEFQCIYGLSTANDYSKAVIPVVHKSIEKIIGTCRIEPSDRIPSYAEWTQDIVCESNNMEVCSISLRTDFNNAKVLEIAIGLDRCLYCFSNKKS